MTTKQKRIRHARISSGFAGSRSGQKSGKRPHSRYALSPYSSPLAAGVRRWSVLAESLLDVPTGGVSR
jgi:hypothetical protein